MLGLKNQFLFIYIFITPPPLSASVPIVESWGGAPLIHHTYYIHYKYINKYIYIYIMGGIRKLSHLAGIKAYNDGL